MLHSILVKWNEQVTDKAALLPDIEALFQGVLTVPGVHAVTLHPNVIDRPNRCDLLICIRMDLSALPAYDDCDAHRQWKAQYGSRIAQKAIFDCDDAGFSA